jgi:hypothetical protein
MVLCMKRRKSMRWKNIRSEKGPWGEIISAIIP